MKNEILRLDGVSKSFGVVKAVDRVDLCVAKGEVLGVLGPNGAGKTTLFNVISGDLRGDAGVIRYDGRCIDALTAHQRCRRGIGRTYQVPQPFVEMTVFENLLVAATFSGGISEHAATRRCVDVLQQTALVAQANRPAGALALLDRKRLELARALATRPALLLLDEIAGGLTEHEAAELVVTLRSLKSEAVTIVWIEHVVHALLAVADRLVVLNFGAKLTEGAPLQVMSDPEVQRVYMGLEV